MNQYDTLLAAIATLDQKEQAQVIKLLSKAKRNLAQQVANKHAALKNINELIKKHAN